MTLPLIECVPNFSEGREESTLLAIESALTSVEGVSLLGRESDADHNRSVFTIAGSPAAVQEAAVRAVGVAAERIDLTQHRGEHLRLGAADVIPFVPVRNITLAECAQIAWAAGEQIWQRFQVPVYFYEAAARQPSRQRLENVRRGQFEGLTEELKTSSERAPDLGRGQLHPTAGASIVGARKFLIAFNVNLQTNRLDIAKAISKKIRASSGGLPHVKAMGIMLHSRNQAQVSINLTDFEVTPLHTVFEAVVAEAASYGVEVAASELIGFIPRHAVELAFAASLKLDRFRSRSVFENALEAKLES
jgi:glutamate formiminotransferase